MPRKKMDGTASLPINVKEYKKKYMQGYCWILLCKEPNYEYKKDKWVAICQRTQEIRNKLAEAGVTPPEMMDMMTRCRDFMDKPFEDMDLDQKVFYAGVVFI